MEEPNQQDEQEQRVHIGFHQLGGIRLVAGDVRLTPQEAFILAGQLLAHGTIAIQMTYAEQAMAERATQEMMKGITLPPGVK